jgi:hypothetical protein
MSGLKGQSASVAAGCFLDELPSSARGVYLTAFGATGYVRLVINYITAHGGEDSWVSLTRHDIKITGAVGMSRAPD